MMATILMIFAEIVPTREITSIIEKIFYFSSVAVGLFLECPNAAASTAPITRSIVYHTFVTTRLIII